MQRYTKLFSVGLTGGIGSGKTTVTNHFASLGITIIDADEVSRSITAPGKPAVTLIAENFGKEILENETTLDRKKLRALVFSNSEKKQQLEQLLHPLIRAKMQQLALNAESNYVIFSIPLLVETNQENLFDRILIVDAPDELRIKWIKQRSGLAQGETEKIMATQATREQRLNIADDVICNDGSLEQLKYQVESLHQKYLHIADSFTNSSSDIS